MKNMFTYYLYFEILHLCAFHSLVIFNEVSQIRSRFQLGTIFAGTIGEFWFCAPRCSCQNRNEVVNWLVRTGMVRRPLLVVGGTGPLLVVDWRAGAWIGLVMTLRLNSMTLLCEDWAVCSVLMNSFVVHITKDVSL